MLFIHENRSRRQPKPINMKIGKPSFLTKSENIKKIMS